MEKNKRRNEWEKALNLMTEEELLFILEHPVGYYSSFLNMVREKLNEDPYSIPENKAMTDAIMNILEGLDCQCELNKDDEICFFFRNAEFYIKFDETFDNIVIFDNSWKKVKVKNSNVAEKMSHAINRTNIWHNVTIAYIIDNEEHVMDIFSSSSIPYYPNMDYLKKHLKNKLVDMLISHNHMTNFLQEEEIISIAQSFDWTIPNLAN